MYEHRVRPSIDLGRRTLPPIIHGISHEPEPPPRGPAPGILLPPPVRQFAIALVVLCLSITAVLAHRYRGETQPSWADAVIGPHFRAAFGGHPRFLELLLLGDPVAMIGMTALLVLFCLSQRRHRAALFVAIASPAAGAVTELLLKPLIHRTFFGGLAFPSGHATGAFSIAVVVAVLLVDPPTPRPTAIRRMLLAGVALGAAVAACAAVLGANNHYPTDIVGGATVATAVVLTTALVVDLLPTGILRRRTTPRRQRNSEGRQRPA